MIIEAIFENLDAKRALFAALEKKAKPDAILATNTSSIPLEEIATALADPARLIGLHFFNPVPRMMLVEIVVGRDDARRRSSPRAAAFVRQIDKLPLPVKSAPGFLVNRVLAPYLMAAMRCVDEGIAPETVDEAALAFGMPMGPIELADTVGLDICVAVGKMLGGDAAPPREADGARRRRQARARRPGTGFYDVGGRQAAEAGRRARCPPGSPSAWSTPYVAEAKSALAERIVADADLVDAGAIFGTGFAPFRGGPLHYAERARGRRSAVRSRAAGVALSVGTRARTHERAPARAHAAAERRGVATTSRDEEERRGKDLAQELSEGRSRGDRRQRVRVGARGVRGELRQVRARARRSRAWASRSPSRELDTLSAAFGAWLQGIGCKKGARVALMMPNILQYPVCLFGILRAGCTVVNVNPLYTPRELEHQLNDSGAEVIVVVENFAHVAAGSDRQDQGAPGDRHVDRRAARLQGHASSTSCCGT